MALLLLAGAGVRRRGLLTEAGRRDLSALVVDVAFPALVLTTLPRTVDAATLAARWSVPVLGFALIAAALGVGLLAARGLPSGAGSARGTLAFVVGTPNWIFFPLPLAEGLYGADGVRTVLLLNVGAQLALWSLGVLVLRGRFDGAAALAGVSRNPGLWATLAAVALVLWAPSMPQGAGGVWVAGCVQAATLLGQLAVPLSFLLAGTGLSAGLRVPPHLRPARTRLVVARLLVAPAVFALCAAALLPVLGLDGDVATARTALLVAAMPVAVTCGPLTDRLGGDAALASLAVVQTTLFALRSH